MYVYTLSTSTENHQLTHYTYALAPPTPIPIRPHPSPHPQPTSEEGVLDDEEGLDLERTSSCRDLVTDCFVTEEALEDNPHFCNYVHISTPRDHLIQVPWFSLCADVLTVWRSVG